VVGPLGNVFGVIVGIVAHPRKTFPTASVNVAKVQMDGLGDSSGRVGMVEARALPIAKTRVRTRKITTNGPIMAIRWTSRVDID